MSCGSYSAEKQDCLITGPGKADGDYVERGREEADPIGLDDLLLTVPRNPNLVSQANHPRINLIY